MRASPVLALLTGLVVLGGCRAESTGAPPLGNAPVTGAPLSHDGTLQVDATDVYFTLYDGVIHRQAKTGGPIVDVVTDPCHASDAIALDDTYVYWARGDTGAGCPGAGVIARAPKAGGAIEVLANGLAFPYGDGLAIDDQNVYMVASVEGAQDGPYLVAIPKAGGAMVQLGGPLAAGSPVLDGQNVYWLTGTSAAPLPMVPPYTLMRTARDGSGSTAVATIDRNVTALAFYDDRIYWVESGTRSVFYSCVDCTQPSAVKSMGPADVSPVTELTMTDGSLVDDVVVDAGSLWLFIEGTESGQGTDGPTTDDHTGRVQRAQRGGGAQSTVLQGLPFRTYLALDDTAVYALADTAPVSASK
jgi:hypothetical protein